MNHQLIGLPNTVLRFALRLVPLVILSFCPTLECRTQSAGIRNAISSSQSRHISINELDWQLINLNVRRAYEEHDDYSAEPVAYGDRRQPFTTSFYVPANSPVLGSTARSQIEQFEVEMNGLRLLLTKILGLSDSLADKIGLYIDADFVTYESPDFVVIGNCAGNCVEE